MDYIYSPEDFNFTLDNHLEYKQVSLSKFDQEIRTKWTDAMNNGYFKYQLTSLQTRIIPGRRGYIAQLNPLRFTERRKPQDIQNINQKFDPNKFNFTKISKQEILLHPVGSHWSASKPVTPSSKSLSDVLKHDENMIIINVSPLEFGHCLIIPQVNQSFPQAITTFGLTLSLECLLLSKHPGFRVGFNSLCALASVNHQHYHCYYFDQQLPVEKCNTFKLSNSIYELIDWPVRGFVFQLDGQTISSFVKTIKTITKFFQEAEIAHNLLMSRGSVLGTCRGNCKNTVCAYLWPRRKFKGAKEFEHVNVALVEMGGQLPVKDKDSYERMSQSEIDEILESVTFTHEEFEDLKKKIIGLLCKEK